MLGYADPEKVGGLIDGAIADTTKTQFFLGLSGRNIPESSRYLLVSDGTWIDLTHITSAAFNPLSFWGAGDLPGVGVELGQALRLSPSGLQMEDFRSNSIGAYAVRQVHFGGDSRSVGQYVQDMLQGAVMSQKSAQSYINNKYGL